MIARQHKALEGFRRAAQLHRAPPECPYVETTEACGGTQKVGRTSNWSTHRSLLNLTFAMRPIQPELATHSSHWSHSFSRVELGCARLECVRRPPVAGRTRLAKRREGGTLLLGPR